LIELELANPDLTLKRIVQLRYAYLEF